MQGVLHKESIFFLPNIMWYRVQSEGDIREMDTLDIVIPLAAVVIVFLD